MIGAGTAIADLRQHGFESSGQRNPGHGLGHVLARTGLTPLEVVPASG